MTEPYGEPSPPPPGQPYLSPYGPAPEPQYPQPQYGPPQYGPPQYGSPQHGPQPYGYPGSPYGPPRARRLSSPTTGWALVGAGVLTVFGSFLPWASVGSLTVNGTSGDGALTLFFGLVIGAMGLVIALRNGLLWTSIVALVFGAFTTLTAAIDAANLSTFSSRFDGIDLSIDPGVGLWLTLLGGLASVVAAVLAMVQRRPVTG